MAVQEGVLFNLYHCFTELTKAAGIPGKIKLSGGILNSEKWLQMCADIFGVPMTIDNTMHGSLMGACVMALEAGGVIASALDFALQETAVIIPESDGVSRYREKFERYLEYYNNN